MPDNDGSTPSDAQAVAEEPAVPAMPPARAVPAPRRPSSRLELTWVGKDDRPRLEPRVLVEDPARSHHASVRRPGDLFDNRVIFGDNLLALKALEAEFAGKVKCVFIDPPYNTGSAFTHYDDGIEHSLWLSLMRDRLEILRTLLTDDGSIWVTLDDNEAHYFKVLCDEVFGRQNFIANVVWQKRTSPDMRATIGAGHDNILVFAREQERFKSALSKLPLTEFQRAQYRNPDRDPRGAWVSADYTAQGYRPNQMYTILTPAGAKYSPPPGVCWKNIEPVFLQLEAEGRIWFGQDGRGMPRKKTYLSEHKGIAAWTWWQNTEVGHNQEAKQESIALFGADAAFDTPKPERLLDRIIQLATNPGDLVLDSFGGSGTTGAVAHKMGRRWILVELGEHCHTHILPRLQKVVDGQDPGGVTEATGWKGGGGFRYYRLAPSLLKQDKWGQWVIDPSFHPELLAEAVCKLEGFRYEPSQEVFWQQGRSTERDFLYATTATLTEGQLGELAREVGLDRSLVVCCGAWLGDAGQWPNLTVKKIPQAVLGRCEFGKPENYYSLNVQALPELSEGDSLGMPTVPATTRPAARPRKTKVNDNQGGLFAPVVDPADEEG
jgi:adenine-specific DNA-methyltransferase